MPRIILDANVVASALINPEGTPGTLVKGLFSGFDLELVLSPGILEEYHRCTKYLRVQKHLRVGAEEIKSRLEELAVAAIWVDGLMNVESSISDRDDKMYLAAAVEGLANFIVTGDRDLKVLGSHGGVQIVTPRYFVDNHFHKLPRGG